MIPGNRLRDNEFMRPPAGPLMTMSQDGTVVYTCSPFIFGVACALFAKANNIQRTGLDARHLARQALLAASPAAQDEWIRTAMKKFPSFVEA